MSAPEPGPVGRPRTQKVRHTTVGDVLRDRLWQSLFGVAAVFALTLAYLFGSVLDTPLLHRTKTVRVELASTGGLFEGSAVTYRGVKVGKVRSIDLTPRGVVAMVSLTSSDPIPVRSVAKVRSLSPVGEQYLDFQPQTRSGPYLRDGSVVPATATDLPKTLASTVISVNRLLGQVDDQKLHTLLSQLATGLAGTGQDVGRLVDQGAALLAELDRLWPQTNRLIDNSGPVLDIAPAQADDLRVLARSSRAFAAFLKDYDPELRATLKAAPHQIDQLQQLLADAEELAPGFLGTAVRFTDLFRPYAPHLGGILSTYGPGIGVLGEAVHDGQLLIEGIPQRSTRCDYGTPRRNPKDPVRRPLVTTGQCSASEENLQRGAAHAPGPVQ
ncbi:MCE family protein [Nocardioides pocheonensis]|uniref:MCE family protein n=1 Tax=Nocardioides pocheonensis TaxID=661485 RepID=A0A3N0GUH8_9ACTN|nr:MlaD family protein [Nocardioides pocheonensis]RNM16114.1 MCE family protein [Nocardioides pocheonensis]